MAGQMLYFCFGDPNYTVNCGVPIDPALALMAAVDRGILYGMNYVEVQGRNHFRRCFHSFE
ncbi:MAG: hypothetical protein DME87_12340 [Verrucomicrobia bacterium]|nr:MAG: hypothetical protein DME87_12340 [Verrucomicrobiota bacterium]